MGTNWNTGSSVWIWEKTSWLWGWQSPGTAVQRVCESPSLGLFKPTWTSSCATWPCCSRGVGLDDLQGSLPIPPETETPAKHPKARRSFIPELWLCCFPVERAAAMVAQGWSKAEAAWMFLLPSKNDSGWPWSDMPLTYYSFSKAGCQPGTVGLEQLENSCMRGLVFPKSRKRWWR